MTEGHCCQKQRVKRNAKCSRRHTVKYVAVSGRNILSKIEEKCVAVDPKISFPEIQSNSDTRCECQKINPYQLAVNGQRYAFNALSATRGSYFTTSD
jgi:hypothetical protein